METTEKLTRRRGRGVPKPVAATPDAFHLGSSVAPPRFRFLSEGQIAEMRDRALALLADYGVVVIHPAAQAALRAAGATEGHGSNRLRLPRGLVEEALATTPKTATLAG